MKTLILFVALLLSYQVIAAAAECIGNKRRLTKFENFIVIFTAAIWSLFYYLN